MAAFRTTPQDIRQSEHIDQRFASYINRTVIESGKKVFVIPDIHLKPWMFARAHELMKKGVAERAVCLMDIPDDWNQQYNHSLYTQTFDAAIAFAREWKGTLWCWGNHDVSYLWNKRESGYSVFMADLVCSKLHKLSETLSDENQLAFVHRIGSVLFSHGGLSDEFVRLNTQLDIRENTDTVIETINKLDREELWQTMSPLWLRPQYTANQLYKAGELLQVVGHTPMKQITQEGSMISCDTFSTYRDGRPFGSQEFLLLDTETWDWEGIG